MSDNKSDIFITAQLQDNRRLHSSNFYLCYF